MRGLDSQKRMYEGLMQGKLKNFLELVKDSKNELFLGIRNEYVNIYYKGGNLLKVSPARGKGFNFKFNNKYLVNSCDFVPKSNEAKEWLDAIPTLKTYIDKYQNGCNANGQVKNEKMSQQSILNNINSSIDSDYYITDMEYSCPGIGYGRFDYIAIKKKEDGKYGLALIELKYGTNAFGTSRKEKDGKISYGSGIVGHALNFSRFVYGVKNNNSFQREKVSNTKYDTLELLRKETLNILRNKIDLGLLDIEANGMSGILEDENIDISENNVETLLICVACEDEDRAKNTISKYLGSNNAAEENVEKLKSNGEIADSFKLKSFVTKEDTVKSLYENQFTDLSI